MPKRKVGEVMWLALIYAKEDRQGLVDAYSGDKREQAVRLALADIRAFEAMQQRLFGTTRTQLEAMMAKMRPVSLMRMMQEDFDPAHPFEKEEKQP